MIGRSLFARVGLHKDAWCRTYTFGGGATD